MKIVKPMARNAGDKRATQREEPIEDIKFDIFKFNNRPKPDNKQQILIICCFSEFGCETVGAMYCLPQLVQEYPGKYKVVVGWHGREYFYKHLVDEFWGIKEEHMWLRERCRAFHHESRNLDKVEKRLKQYGAVVSSAYLGRLALGAKCFNCSANWGSLSKVSVCPYCGAKNVRSSVLGDISFWKPRAVLLPFPSDYKLEQARSYLGENPVGVFGRGRKCYGRNLQPGFYVKLISLLEEMGYTPIWLGEKATTQPCPVDHIVDFSRKPESKDLELTLAIIKQCCFTIQFWTASTRLAGMMGVPYILFESPDQIYGKGQEGFRRNLCDFGPRKLSINHFLNVYNDNESGLEIVRKCVEEVQSGDFSDRIGLVENYSVVKQMIQENSSRIGVFDA